MLVMMRLAALLILLAAGCSGYDDVALLELQAVEPSLLEGGAKLGLHGQGFPLGQIPEVTLEGELFRPGAASTPLRTELEGTVKSELLIEVPVDEALIARMGGRATFRGFVRVSFRAADDRRDVFARKQVRLDFLPDTSTQLRAEAAGTSAETESERLGAEAFGVGLANEYYAEPGVRVTYVQDGSLAAEQGMLAGDIVVALDGVHLYHRRDFVADPSQTESVLLVRRSGLPSVYELRWPHEASVYRASSLAMLVFALTGLLLGWASPAWLVWRRPAQLGVRRWFTDAAFIAAFGTILSFVSLLQWTTPWILLLGLLSLGVAYVGRRKPRFIRFSFVLVAIVALMTLVGTSSIASIVAQQGPAPLSWWLLQSPAAGLVFLAQLHGLGDCRDRARLGASAYCAAAAVLGAALFMGGWAPAPAPWGALWLALKALAILIAARLLRLQDGVVAVFAAVGLALAVASPWIGVTHPEWGAMALGFFLALLGRALLPLLRHSAAVPSPA